MTNWKLTATTIFCDTIESEVTILVYKDGNVSCTGFDALSNSADTKSEDRKQKIKSPCDTVLCPSVTAYRNKLFAEEQS